MSSLPTYRTTSGTSLSPSYLAAHLSWVPTESEVGKDANPAIHDISCYQWKNTLCMVIKRSRVRRKACLDDPLPWELWVSWIVIATKGQLNPFWNGRKEEKEETEKSQEGRDMLEKGKSDCKGEKERGSVVNNIETLPKDRDKTDSLYCHLNW